jgi:hypothetical protein
MNRKLTLDLDALAVATFRTDEAAPARGTVNANGYQPCPWSQITSCPATVHTCASFDRSCRADA